MSVVIESSRLPSMVMAADVKSMEASDVCGRIIRTKALAEPCFGSADIAHVAIDQ